MWSLIDHISPGDLGLDGHEQGWLQLPTPVDLGNSHVRVYFATRRQNRPHVRYVDLHIEGGRLVNRDALHPSAPLIEPGGTSWDLDGVYPSSVVRVDDGYLLYTIGWLRGAIDPIFTSRIGVARLDQDANVAGYAPHPILNLTSSEPFLITSPCVRRKGSEFEMLYVSGDAWIATPSGPDSRYSLRIARSPDGILWNERGQVALGLDSGYTHIARPAFLQDEADNLLASVTTEDSSLYRLRVCAKVQRDKWAVGHVDLRSNAAADDVAAYPAILRRPGEIFLFANGSDRGRSGFSILRTND